jgi:hypothetical protein
VALVVPLLSEEALAALFVLVPGVGGELASSAELGLESVGLPESSAWRCRSRWAGTRWASEEYAERPRAGSGRTRQLPISAALPGPLPTGGAGGCSRSDVLVFTAGRPRLGLAG